MTLAELFSKNRNIIINSDIDGFLSGMILQQYYGCTVVGFSNSKETIWVTPETESIYDPIYIDLYVNKPEVVCIEQHIVAFDEENYNKIRKTGTKINPNIERGRTFSGDVTGDYYHKYPFGTVHYLISLMAKEGLHVDLGNLHRKKTILKNDKTFTIEAGHVLLRADDALFSTLSKYKNNALDWWEWLDPDRQFPAIQSILEFIKDCKEDKAQEYKDDIGEFFTRALECDNTDGSFNEVTNTSGNILARVKNYNNIIGELMSMHLDLPEKTTTYTGTIGRHKFRLYEDKNKFEKEELFSYAFVKGPNSDKNFSYTLNMKKTATS